MLKNLVLLMGAGAVAFGCAGNAATLYVKDSRAQESAVVFPKGTVFGGASKEQASTLAKLLVDSHNLAMNDMGEVKSAQAQMLKGQDEIKAAARQTQERLLQLAEVTEKTAQRNYEVAEAALRSLEQMAKRQGTGELTVFFPTGVSRVAKNSLDYERIVHFADYLARESRGRKVLLISVGCASTTGNKKLNTKLARDRAEYPVDIVRHYLVNTPHEFYKVYGVGDIYSPQNVSMREHLRYQHTRLIAVFEGDTSTELPVEPPMEHF